MGIAQLVSQQRIVKQRIGQLVAGLFALAAAQPLPACPADTAHAALVVGTAVLRNRGPHRAEPMGVYFARPLTVPPRYSVQ